MIPTSKKVGQSEVGRGNRMILLQRLLGAHPWMYVVLLNCVAGVGLAEPPTQTTIEIIRSRGHERLVVMVPQGLEVKWHETVNGQVAAGVYMSVSSGACAAAVANTGSWALGSSKPTERSRQIIVGDGAKEFYGLTPMSEGCRWLPTASVDLTLSYASQRRQLLAAARLSEVFAPTEKQDRDPVEASVVWINGLQWLALFNRASVPLALGMPVLAPVGEPGLDFALRRGEVALFYSASLSFCSTHGEVVIASFHDDGSYRLRHVSLSPANRDLLKSVRKWRAQASTVGTFAAHCGIP
jgi:hypothetical protein